MNSHQKERPFARIAMSDCLGHPHGMARSTALFLLAPIALALAGCGQSAEDEQEGANTADAATPDPVKNTTTEAMCGNPSDRANAIARIAEGPKHEADPDYVYDVASDIAEKGCPKPKG